MDWIGRIPVIGTILSDLLASEHTRYRRYLDREDRRRRIAARILTVLALLTGLAYLVWVYYALNPAHPLVGAGFFIAEIACWLLFLLAGAGVWRMRHKPPEGLPADHPFSVDVLIPTCGEAIAVIRKALEAAAAIQWHGTVRCLVLDDAGSDQVRYVAEQLGFRYLSRAASGVEKSDGKGGNLNFGLRQGSGELVLVLDADQICRPEIVQVMAGYMRFPRVAFVQSKQHYMVPVQDPFFNRDLVFYEAVQLGLDNSDSVISCGSGVLYRRAALEEIGGFATWNLVEDLTTSYELHSRGWKSFYYPHALTAGLAPGDIWGVYQQRGQWALDTMRLFYWDNPLFKKGLTWLQRLGYLIIGFSYPSSCIK
ncbi:MAG: glycosyltransferase [Acidobacteria bacterium]|nr:glycosyltransferase [Acidobacteriota bacterium]